MLRRICEEIKHHFSLNRPVPKSLKELKETWFEFLGDAGNNGSVSTILTLNIILTFGFGFGFDFDFGFVFLFVLFSGMVLVIDGLNLLEVTFDSLDWIPKRLPDGVKLVISTNAVQYVTAGD